MYVDFFFLIAGPGQIDTVQHAFFHVALPFDLIEEIFGEVRVTEEQPVLTFRTVGGALLHKGAERRDAGARANHDDRGLRVRRQAEVVVVLNEHAHFALFFHAVGEEAGSTTRAGTAFNIVAHDADGHVHFAFNFRL